MDVQNGPGKWTVEWRGKEWRELSWRLVIVENCVVLTDAQRADDKTTTMFFSFLIDRLRHLVISSQLRKCSR